MSTMLLTVSVTFLTDLILADLIFRIDFNKFVNLLMFKIMLMNSV